MKERLKVGSRVSCVVEALFPNFLSLSFRSAGVIYRGVLFHETCSTVQRAIPANYYKEKQILQQDVTDSLYEAVNSRDVDTKSKGLRSKKVKPSCLVLDDYIFETEEHTKMKKEKESKKGTSSESSVEKSPIDSLCGLIESIDKNVGKAPPVNEEKPVAIPDIKPTPQNSIIDSTHKTSTDQKTINCVKSNKNIKVSSNVSVTIQRVDVKNEKDAIESCPKQIVKRSVVVEKIFDVENRERKRKKSNGDVDNKTNVKDSKIGSGSPSSVKKTKRNECESPSIESITSPDDKKKRKKIKKLTYDPKNRRRLLKIAARKSLTADAIVNEDAIPIVKIERKKTIRKPGNKQKRIDPITLALKNIKNRENTRRRQRLSMMTRRALTASPNDLLRKAERKPLKKQIIKKKKKTLSTDKEEDIVEEDGNNTKEEEQNIKTKPPSEPPVTRNKTRSTRLRIDSQSEVKGKKFVTRSGKERELIPKKTLNRLKPLRITAKKKSVDGIAESFDVSKSPSNISETSNANNVSTNTNVLSPTTSHVSSNHSTEIDLLCHEEIESSETRPSVMQQQQQRKNRRKPLQVFKSLPNPATGPDVLNDDEFKDLREYNAMDAAKKITEEQKIEETKSVSVTTTQVLSKVVVKRSDADLFGIDSLASERPYKITIARMNRPTLMPRRFLDNKFAPSYKTFIQQPVPILKPSPLKRLQKPGTMLRRRVETDSTSSVSSTETSTLNEKYENVDDDDEKCDARSVVTDKEKESSSSNDLLKVSAVPKPKKRRKQAIFDFHDTLKPLTRTNEDIRLGDIVWGKVFGYGWWPGKVLSNVRDADSEKRRVFCTWMGSNTNSTMNIGDLELFMLNFEKRFDVKKSSNSYSKAVVEAQQCCRTKYGLK